MLAIDTETTGLDLWHGCRPFFVSVCRDDGELSYWEWDVDPMTRTPKVLKSDIKEICEYTDIWIVNEGVPHVRKKTGPGLVYHNSKFDIRGMNFIGIPVPNFDRVDDTLIMSHCLASAESHKLKDLALQYLNINDEDQQELKDAVMLARRIANKKDKKWRIAKGADPHWPAVKSPPKTKEGDDKWWPCDMWLPRAVAKHDNYKKGHPWWTVCQRYALLDAERTLGLYYVFKQALQEENLVEQYELRRRNIKVTYKIEDRGIPYHIHDLEVAAQDYSEEIVLMEQKCKNLVNGNIDNLGSYKQLQGIVFGELKVKPIKETKTGYATDGKTIDQMLLALSPKSRAFHFLTNLKGYRSRLKAIDYLNSYRLGGFNHQQYADYRVLHCWLNITGTDTTRLSSFNPNTQNISKKEGFNLRRVFGPLPRREWYSIDFSNIELRIFAFAAEDEELLDAFATGYSVHLLMFEDLYPKIWQRTKEQVLAGMNKKQVMENLLLDRFNLDDPELIFYIQKQIGDIIKSKYESTYYQWVKNGNFALIYGAYEDTADATYHLPGAYRRVRERFPHIDAFIHDCSATARSDGHITTLGGYRLQVPRNEPHKAANYYVQGSAGIAMQAAMVRVDDYLEEHNDYHLNMTIHDELDFDFPIHKRNLKVISECKRLMELSGDDFGIELPVDVTLIRKNWAQEEKVKCLAA